jgi:excisionase family DNA binding protein
VARSSDGPSHEGEIFTTHQVAKMLGVSLPTIINWCNQDRLFAHRTPGGHRRIGRDEILRFVAVHGYPVPALLKGASVQPERSGGVLVVSSEADFADLVTEYLKLKRDYSVWSAGSPLMAGMYMGRFSPQVVIWDEVTPGLDLRGLESLMDRSGFSQVRLILTTDFLTLEHRAAMESGQLYTVLQKPVSLELLLESLDRAHQTS